MLTQQNLSEWSNKLPLLHRVWEVQSHWPRYSIDVGGRLVSIRLQYALLPHCQGGGGQFTKRTQVQIPRVAGAVWRSSLWTGYMEAFQGYLGSPEFSWGDLRHVGDVVTIWEKGFLTQRSNSTSTHKIQYVTVSKPERHCWHRTEFSRMSVMKSRAVHGSHVEEFFPF